MASAAPRLTTLVQATAIYFSPRAHLNQQNGRHAGYRSRGGSRYCSPLARPASRRNRRIVSSGRNLPDVNLVGDDTSKIEELESAIELLKAENTALRKQLKECSSIRGNLFKDGFIATHSTRSLLLMGVVTTLPKPEQMIPSDSVLNDIDTMKLKESTLSEETEPLIEEEEEEEEVEVEAMAETELEAEAEAEEEEEEEEEEVYEESDTIVATEEELVYEDEEDQATIEEEIEDEYIEEAAADALATEASETLALDQEETEGVLELELEEAQQVEVDSEIDGSLIIEDSEEEEVTLRSIVFVTSEVSPWSKTGGLGDVCSSLPTSLAKRGHRVMVISPRYLNDQSWPRFRDTEDLNVRINLWCFGENHEVAYFYQCKDGVDYLFVDHPSYHRPGNPYGDTRGPFGDNQFRYTLLSLAACEAPLRVPLNGYTYGESVCFIANDWHAGLVPVYIAANYRPHGVYQRARTIMAIHNLSHQGVEAAYTFESMALPGEWYGAVEWVFPEWARVHEFDTGEAVNYLKGGIVTADRIITVSQGYAWEITTVEGGWGLDTLLRSRQFVLSGIVNGVDSTVWNPETDEHITENYSADDLSGKEACKLALQVEVGLPQRRDVPLVGFIGRLDYQKGPDLIFDSLERMLAGNDVQMVILGSGDSELEDKFREAETHYHDKFRAWIGFSEPISHKITAGCDILLMPSRFEPCGLNQLYALRYGTVPVVHATGGLRDTVEHFNPFASPEGSGTGWTFTPPTVDSMLGALFQAIDTFRNFKDTWNAIVKRGMTKDLSWDRSAREYEKILDWSFHDPPSCG